MPPSPSARAPPRVAASIAWTAWTPVGSGSATPARRQNIFMPWNMFWQSPQEQLSQPSAKSTPSARSDRMGATPLFSFMLLRGLWATRAPARAIAAISSGAIQTPCAMVVRGPRTPTSAMWRIIEPPCRP